MTSVELLLSREIRKFDKMDREKKIKYIEKQIGLIDFQIEHTDKIITLLYKQQERLIERKNTLKKLLKNKDFGGFKHLLRYLRLEE